eukprot:6362544-Amphidinium_carterae.1
MEQKCNTKRISSLPCGRDGLTCPPDASVQREYAPPACQLSGVTSDYLDSNTTCQIDSCKSDYTGSPQADFSEPDGRAAAGWPASEYWKPTASKLILVNFFFPAFFAAGAGAAAFLL